jgi:hypothetical protein
MAKRAWLLGTQLVGGACNIWDATGRLGAQSLQLAKVHQA